MVLKYENDELVGNVAKFISDEEKAALVKTHELNHGDVLFLEVVNGKHVVMRLGLYVYNWLKILI